MVIIYATGMPTAAEPTQLTSEWNRTDAEFPDQSCIHELFAARAASSPDAIAQIHADRFLTYRELNLRANRLAHHLRRKGVGHEVVVGLHVERSLDMVIGMLGIMKAGAAYLPLDPSYPGERLRLILDQALPSVVITQPDLLGSLAHYVGEVVCLDEAQAWFRSGPAHDPVTGVTSESAAYVIFTSGSTGRPKGVVGLHKGFVNRMVWMWREYPFTPGERCCQKASLSFIDSIGEVFVPLIHGVPSVIIPDSVAKDPLLLVDELARHEVTRITLVSTLLRMVLTTVENLGDRLPNLKAWFSSGEALPDDLARLFFRQIDADLNNLYGPSEASIEVTSWRCQRDNASGRVAIGRPIANSQIYVLDREFHPAPVGETGDLYIAGVNLARGYHQEPGLTAAAFLPNPFSATAGSRMYRSGDLARYTSEGVLEYRGRADSQVKIRGYRVELDEVEAALRAHPALREVAVIAHEVAGGSRKLVAFYVAAPPRPVDSAEVRAFLEARLPPFMVPSLFTALDSLPRTATGKLDRRSLLAVRLAPSASPSGLARTHDEAALVEIFAAVLALPGAGIHDNFFDLGGDSLQATQVLSRIRERYRVALPLRTFIAEPTVSALLRKLLSAADLATSDRASAEVDAIRPTDRQDALLMSSAQERMWFLCQMPSTQAYTTTVALRLEGSLRLTALAQAINDIVQRHESLRTVFPTEAGVAVPRVLPMAPIAVPCADLSRLVRQGGERSLNRFIRQQCQLGFDLAAGPLLQACLVRLGASSHVLVLNLHHIVFDGWSWGIFQRELTAHYEARLEGRPASLATLPIQYADYAAWQRAGLQSSRARQQLEFWARHLSGAPTLLEMPLDRRRPPKQSFRGRSLRFSFPPRVVGALREASRRSGATLYMVLLAAYTAVLNRHSGQQDLCLGTPIANRNRAAIEPLIGLFVNTLVLRLQIDGEATLGELLSHVREIALEAYDHQDLPFEVLVKELRPQRSLSHAPIFQLMFALDASSQRFELGGLEAYPVEIDSEHSLFDLSLTVHPEADNLYGVFEYSSDLFDAPSIARLSAHYLQLITAAMASPGIPLSQLAILGPGERHYLEIECNQSAAEYGLFRFVDELFREQVAATPLATAVVCDDRRISYGALNAEANRLAQRLQAVGIGPERLVAICLERSIEMIVAVLAVQKSGGAYLPLDPDYPEERLTFMLRDSCAPVLLTRRRLAGKIRDHQAKVVFLDDRGSRSSTTDDPSAAGRSPDNLAYVIYTSGSTGRPKGVMISHRNLTNAFRGWDDAYGLRGRCTSHLQMASFSFDVFTGDVVRALCSGAQLVLASRETMLSPAALYSLMQEHGVDAADFAPPLLRNLEQYLLSSGEDLSFLALMVVGTDAWNVTEFRRWRALCAPRTRFLNAYGVTEATVASSYFEATHHELPAEGLVPIGRPLPNARLYILDGHRRSVPIGATGELYIGGAGVGRGYLNRPRLTHERFLSDPFSARPEARLYRTGDLVRRLANGNIELLGRGDDQVKIRGFRVELGEVESALLRHPRVRETTVLAVADPTGSRRLQAYLVADADSPSVAELRGFLAESLPDHMVPGSFVIVDAFPLTPNGKVDRQVLQRLGTPLAGRADAGTRPRTPEEEILVALWAEILEVSRVGIHDSFFDLGGHSLLAMRLIARLQEAFSIQLPVSALFEEPTIAELAGRVQRSRSERPAEELRPLVPLPDKGDAPLSFAQQRLWFQSQFAAANVAYNMLTQVRLRGELRIAALERSLRAIIDRHSALRTSFPLVDGSPVQRVAEEQVLTLARIDLAGTAEAARREAALRLAAQEADRPFHLATGPLVRATLITLEPADHLLLLTLHHIVSDAWSAGIMIRELGRNYRAFVSGGRSPSAPLPIHYRDFSAWQRQGMAPRTTASRIAYWRQQLAGAPALLVLPTDRPRPAEQRYRGRTLRFTIDAELTGGLRRMGARAGASLYMSLLAALATLLSRTSGQHDLCIGSPIANRGRSEIEELMGFFVNTLVMRLDLSDNPRFSQLLRQAREVSLGAYDHQDLPFEQLVEALSPERNLGHAPLFQVMLVLQNAPAEPLVLDGLSVEPMEIPNATAKFDLLLSLQEGDSGLVAELEYNTDLFDADRVARMAGHYRTLLRAVVCDAEIQAQQLPLLTAPERHQLLIEWNDTRLDSRLGTVGAGCLHHAFEAQARETPDRVAVVLEDGGYCQRLTYRQLNACANRLAHPLRVLGVGPDVTVGLCLPRSPEMAVGLLAVLKAGGAYVPLDPAYPPDRLRFMLEDAGCSVLLTARAVALTASPEIATVFLDELSPQEASPHDPRTEVTPDHLIYITYTSGSTGKPKGIAMPHRAVANLISWHGTISSQRAISAVPPDATTLQFAPLSFDVSFQEIFSTWCAGGTLVLISEQDRRDPAKLLALLSNQAVQRLFLPTAALQPLATMASSSELPGALGEIWVAGEQLQITREIRDWFSRMPDCRLINFYGPSECHAVTWLAIDGNPSEWPALPSIGRPIANTQIYLLDAHQELVPCGVPGEIHIGGAGVARGYLNRPRQNQEHFLPDPFRHAGEGRMYRTGDQARLLPDGNIEFLGRLDGQVKIRGVRIEIGEIETMLAEHPSVGTAVVVVHPLGAASKTLVAYVTSSPGLAAEPGDLARYVADALPEYMVPSTFVVLDSFPLTASGKIDRAALARLGPPERSARQEIARPRDGLEAQLVRLWEETLNLRPIGIHDNFFDLGGHSLLAMSLVGRIQASLGGRVPVELLFHGPTVAKLASQLRKGGSLSWSCLVGLRVDGTRPPFFCVHPGGGNVFCYLELMRHLPAEQPVYGLQSPGLDPRQRPLDRIEEMGRIYLRALREVQPEGPYRLGGWSLGGVIAFEMARQLRAAGQEVAKVILIDSAAPATQGAAHLANEAVLVALARDLGGMFGRDIGISHQVLENLLPEARLDHILECARRADVLPPDVTPATLRRIVEVFKGNLEGYFRYLPVPQPGELVLIAADNPREPATDEVLAAWRALATDGVAMHKVPGDHYTLLARPAVAHVAAILEEHLGRG
jgi:amino acid adenylation domain-containing protein